MTWWPRSRCRRCKEPIWTANDSKWRHTGQDGPNWCDLSRPRFRSWLRLKWNLGFELRTSKREQSLALIHWGLVERTELFYDFVILAWIYVRTVKKLERFLLHVLVIWVYETPVYHDHKIMNYVWSVGRFANGNKAYNRKTLPGSMTPISKEQFGSLASKTLIDLANVLDT